MACMQQVFHGRQLEQSQRTRHTPYFFPCRWQTGGLGYPLLLVMIVGVALLAREPVN